MIESMLDYLVGHAWVGEVFLIVLGTAMVHLCARLAFARLDRKFGKTDNIYDDALLDARRRPRVCRDSSESAQLKRNLLSSAPSMRPYLSNTGRAVIG